MAVALRASTALPSAAEVKFADHTRHQIAVRLLPFLFILYIINYLDRTSVAYAAIGMSRDSGVQRPGVRFGRGHFFRQLCTCCRYLARWWWNAGVRGVASR